jgi:hypothetical protein
MQLFLSLHTPLMLRFSKLFYDSICFKTESVFQFSVNPHQNCSDGLWIMDYDVVENTHKALHSLSGKYKRNVKLNFCELHTMACILSIQADIEFYQLDCSLGLSFKLLAEIFFMLFI